MRYSQKDEQDWILRAVGDKVGRFLDIGAYDGVSYSNTMCLVERGWGGVMVEPGLEAFQELLKNHGNNSKITLVHGAVGARLEREEIEIVPFWNNPKTFSTTQDSNRQKFFYEGFAQFYVPVFSLDLLLDFVGKPLDVVSIDTEGTSVDLFKRLLFLIQNNLPTVICVEHDGKVNECQLVAGRYPYKLAMGNEENLIFVKA